MTTRRPARRKLREVPCRRAARPFTKGSSEAMIASMTHAGQRIGRRDIAIAAVLSTLGLWLMVDNVVRLTDGKPPTADEHSAIEFGGLLPVELGIPLFLLVTLPLLWRRVAPIHAVSASVAGLAVNMLLIGSDFLRC